MRRPSDPARLRLGIDAGGSGIRALATAGCVTVFEGRGGPGNPLSVSEESLSRNYLEALRGCPAPDVVVACAAGAGGPKGAARVEGILRPRFPRAAVHVLADYRAALSAAKGHAEVVVIAGTGSIVCSHDPDGSISTSGGLGWIIGDHGSGARLGRALLDDYGLQARETLAGPLEEIFGSASPMDIAISLLATDAPQASLARAAPLLTVAADAGEEWARLILVRELGLLADLAVGHIDRFFDTAEVAVAVCGGVFGSPAARSIFGLALSPRVEAPLVPVDPLEGAMLLAAGMDLR